MPTYGGIEPTRPADDANIYTFLGWDKVLSLVNGDAEYIAQYGSTTQSYTITVVAENGTTTGSGTYQYGTQIEIGVTPNDCYLFVGWNDGNSEQSRTITVTGNATYTAFTDKIKYSVSVTSSDDTMGEVSITPLQ